MCKNLASSRACARRLLTASACHSPHPCMISKLCNPQPYKAKLTRLQRFLKPSRSRSWFIANSKIQKNNGLFMSLSRIALRCNVPPLSSRSAPSIAEKAPTLEALSSQPSRIYAFRSHWTLPSRQTLHSVTPTLLTVLTTTNWLS